jgi:lauroyl/myristoyl acyltransferase
LAFYAIRNLEQRVSPTGLYMALAPLAFARAAFSFSQRFPEYFCEPPSSRKAWRARMNYLLGRGLEFIPDRLATAKWQARFQTTGLVHIQEARERKRSVVLVCFHFGAFKLIPFWLRSQGIPVIALLGGESGSRSAAKRMKDKLSPFSPLPTVLYRKDQLRSVVRFLRTGHVLFVAVDRETGKRITIPINEHCSFQMATGAIRLAAKCDAELIPCFMIDEGRWQFRLEIGQPVPSEFLTTKLDNIGAAQHLLRELLPVVSKHPEFCADYLVNCLRPNVSISGEKTFVE